MANFLSEPTRYMAAKAIINHSFAQTVIKLEKESHKYTAENYGIDMYALRKAAEKSDAYFLARNIAISAFCLPFVLWFFYALNDWKSESSDYIIPISWSIFISGTITFIHKQIAKKYIRKNYLAEPLITEEVAQSSAGNYNLVVYSGKNPFVGFGENIGGWVLTVDTEKKNDRTNNTEISTIDLENNLIESINQIGIKSASSYRTIFADGKKIRNCRDILPDQLEKPNRFVKDSVVSKYSSDGDFIRTYCQMRIHEWNDQVIVSIFFRAYKMGRNIIIDVNYFFLPPLSEQYDTIESISEELDNDEMANEVLASLIKGAFNIIMAPLHILSILAELLGSRSERKKMENKILKNPMYDYGAKSSLREIESGRVRNYFQIVDRIGVVKIIEKNILESLVNYLEKYGIDTSEIKERQSAILNNGIIISGGNVTANGIVAGSGASSTIVQGAIQGARNLAAGSAGTN